MTDSKPLAVVTGASSGIGATFARTLAARGYDLALVARRQDRLKQLADELSERFHVNCILLKADLTQEADLRTVEDFLAGAAHLQLLVNNAGFGSLGRFYEAPIESQDAMHRLHVLATMRLTHAALRNLTARNQGAIINVASVAAYVPRPGSTSYYATKAWMNCFTEGLYLELKTAGSRVRVQSLCPGFTYTEFHDVIGGRTEFHLQRLVDARRGRGEGLARGPGKGKTLRGAGMALQAAGIADSNDAAGSAALCADERTGQPAARTA